MADDLGLIQMLDAVRDGLLTADLPALETLSDQIGATLSATPAPALAALPGLRDRAERNATLLASALKGVRAAQRRAAEIAAHGHFSTYGADGRRGEMAIESFGSFRRA